MGCDIHLHSEVLIGGVWQHYGVGRITRNYRLFARMAGVRNYNEWEITPIAEPRGFPGDASAVTRVDYDKWDSDAHTPSYLEGLEICILESQLEWLVHTDKTRERFGLAESMWGGYLFGDTWSGWVQYPENYPPELHGIRFVFWFDN